MQYWEVQSQWHVSTLVWPVTPTDGMLDDNTWLAPDANQHTILDLIILTITD